MPIFFLTSIHRGQKRFLLLAFSETHFDIKRVGKESFFSLFTWFSVFRLFFFLPVFHISFFYVDNYYVEAKEKLESVKTCKLGIACNLCEKRKYER